MNSFKRPPAVTDVTLIRRSAFSTGPFRSKSGADLTVLFAIPQFLLAAFSRYDEDELAKLPTEFDIRGLRSYTVSPISKDAVGGMESHRIRTEAVFISSGLVDWMVEDLYGNKTSFILGQADGLLMPPWILHTYRALEEGSGLIVLANTLFDQNDPRTHDSPSEEEFRALQNHFRT